MPERVKHSGDGWARRTLRGLTTLAVVAWAAWSSVWVIVAVSGGSWYGVDLGLAYQAQAIGAAAGLAVWCLAWRRWRAGAVVAGTIVLAAWPMLVGRAVALPGVAMDRAPADGTVRIVTCNINPRNERWREDLATVFSWRPDVVVLIETPPEMWHAIVRRGEYLGTDWPYEERRAWVSDIASPCFVLSRWPMERLGFEGIADADRDVMIARVDRPAGPFLIGAIHPHSPRTLPRWRLGNRQMRTTSAAIERALASHDEAMVIGVDLNSGPAGWRAGLLRGAGLRMSKPWTGGVGSFPAQTSPALRVQLDDVWQSGGVRVRAWSSPGGLSSDHRAVVVDVQFTE